MCAPALFQPYQLAGPGWGGAWGGGSSTHLSQAVQVFLLLGFEIE